MAKNPVADILRAHLPEFEKQTGIKVDFQALTNEQLSQKMFVQMTVGSESPDVFMIRPLEELSLYENNGWLTPLESYAVSDPRYDFADFSSTALESVTVNGKLLAVPLSTEQQILYYRKDLLEKRGSKSRRPWTSWKQRLNRCMIPSMVCTVLSPEGNEALS